MHLINRLLIIHQNIMVFLVIKDMTCTVVNDADHINNSAELFLQLLLFHNNH